MKKICIFNQKGGVGKTTTNINLCAYLAMEGYKVLTIDIDPQGNTTSGFGIDKRNLDYSMYDVLTANVPLKDVIIKSELITNLYIAPSTMELAGAEVEIIGVKDRETILLREISKIQDQYDFIFIGRLVPFKMADIAIKAFANVAKENSNINFHIVGDGPCLNEYKRLIERLEMERQIILHGELDRNDALEMLMSSKAFLFPSAREGGAWVLFEAMMCSKPIICLDTSGMNVVVTNETGIKMERYLFIKRRKKRTVWRKTCG